MGIIAEKTQGHIVGSDGALIIRPTTIIDADGAALIRAYFEWAMKHQLEPELFCGNCFTGLRSDKAIFNITDQEIEIVCQCRQLVHFGASLPRAAMAPCVTSQADAGSVGVVILSADVALLLRHYKAVLLALNLKEALRCNACYSLEQEDGCDASVTSQSIRIDCRCSTRRYAGMTT